MKCYVSGTHEATLGSYLALKCSDGDEFWEFEKIPLSKAGGLKIHDPVLISIVPENTGLAQDINCKTSETGSETSTLKCAFPESKTKNKWFSLMFPSWMLPEDCLSNDYPLHVVLTIDEKRRATVEKIIKLQEEKEADKARRKAEYAKHKARGENITDSDEESDDDEEDPS